MSNTTQGVNTLLSQCGNHPEPPREPGCLGEMLASIVLALVYGSQEQTTAKEQWGRARTDAAKQWRRNR